MSESTNIIAYDTPLRNRHEQYVRDVAANRGLDHNTNRPGAAVGEQVAVEVNYLPYGPSDTDSDAPRCEIVSDFGEVQAEYAAIRRGVGLFDSPHRATLRVTGTDRVEFLNRMLTAELKDLTGGMARPTFWLNRKGRIDADLVVVELGDLMLIDVDIFNAEKTVETLEEFLFAEEVEITNVTNQLYRIGAHGKLAANLFRDAEDGSPIQPLAAHRMTIAGVDVTVYRRNITGEPGLECIVPRDSVENVWDELLAANEQEHDAHSPARVRPIGWQALNIARIEAGTPLYNIDFGPTNLPHETGILHDRVSFTKGCYLGQEVVARMESLGRPKQKLVGLKMTTDLLPIADSQVFEKPDEQAEERMGPQIGAVTSSTLSPLLGATPIAFAMIKTKHAEPGNTVLVNAEGEQAETRVQELSFL